MYEELPSYKFTLNEVPTASFIDTMDRTVTTMVVGSQHSEYIWGHALPPTTGATTTQWFHLFESEVCEDDGSRAHK